LHERAEHDENQDNEYNCANDELSGCEVVTEDGVVIHCVLLCGIDRDGERSMVCFRAKREATQPIVSAEADE
jgi:hypothetical protein